MDPIKHTSNSNEARYSKWLEAMRKDGMPCPPPRFLHLSVLAYELKLCVLIPRPVECTFGILKCRFRILKTGFRIRDRAQIDHVWRTCCALHNLLLDVDGRADLWQNDVAPPGEESPLGLFEADDVPNVFARLEEARKSDPAVRDLSGMEEGDIVRGTASYRPFQRELVEHLAYRWNLPAGDADAIVWPRSNKPGVPPPHVVQPRHDER